MDHFIYRSRDLIRLDAIVRRRETPEDLVAGEAAP
jgi:hypothetical protein